MNKKIFTLLAGTFLMFAAVLSVTAQAPVGHGLWDKSRLKLAEPVKRLGAGANLGYYHLKVDSVHTTRPVAPGVAPLRAGLGAGYNMNDTIVLFMGADKGTGHYNLFIDTLNHTSDYKPLNEFKSDSKAEASAASLWCVTVNTDDQGQNPTFDFSNKQQNQLLEVDLYGYESWPLDPFAASGARARVGKNVVPGGVSAWKFSVSYNTTIDSLMPLYSYIDGTFDSVAVLCIDSVERVGAALTELPKVVVKIAAATDVRAGKVDGVLYFTLTEAAPFIVNELDYNTMFGSKLTATGGILTFNPDATNESNPFTNKSRPLTAQYIDHGPTDFGLRIRPAAGWDPIGDYTNQILPNFSDGGNYFDVDTIKGSTLDSLGYLWLKNGNGFLTVKESYLQGASANMRYLDLGYRTSGDGYPGTTIRDSVLYAQSAFRLVYYPSGDSIYINAYQGTYLPNYDMQSPINMMQAYQISPNGWRDSVTQAVFTYFADSAALANPNAASWPAVMTDADLLEMVTARLKYGQKDIKFPLPYKYYHRLYIALQDLAGSARVTLHTNNKTFKDGRINTQINFDLYKSCDLTIRTETTIDADLYLIRNERGEYLYVPLHLATDSAEWDNKLDPNVHPELLPSYQWVIEKMYPSAPTSPVIITNREFGWLQFTAQLDKETGKPFDFRAKNYKWNDKPINAQTVPFGEHAVAGNTTKTFIALKKEHKSDPLMGYTWIDPDTSIVSLYALNYRNALNSDLYLGIEKNFPVDSFIYGDKETDFEKLFFRFDTIREAGYGGLLEYGYKVHAKTQVADLVTLQRQAYRLSYENPYKMLCSTAPLSLANTDDKHYTLKPRGTYREILGKPVFYLRHMYHEAGNNEASFALVQRIDTTTWNWAAGGPTVEDRYKLFLEEYYGPQFGNAIFQKLSKAGEFNDGLFVASVDEHTGKLMMSLRVESQSRYSAFIRQRDNDPIYRRFNTTNEGAYATDAPDTVHFYSTENEERYLFENTGAIPEQHKYYKYKVDGMAGEFGGKNYLGIVSRPENPTVNTAIFVDTAFINRKTGYVKPQYLLMVDPKPIADGMGCDDDGNETIPLPGYMRGRYLINAYDSAYNNATGKDDYSYIWHLYTRLVFTDAIHVNDHLYILGEYGSDAKLKELGLLTNRTDGKYKAVDINALHTYATSANSKIRAIDLGSNTHKDCVFQFRLVERGSNDFIIESETTDRDTIASPMIRPCTGGWVKIENNVPVITRADDFNAIGESYYFNVYPGSKEGYDPNPTDNEKVATVSVIGNAGSVSILNAAGKKVVISNILGQTVASTTLTSDDETVPAPKGIVIVSIEKEDAVKTLVK